MTPIKVKNALKKAIKEGKKVTITYKDEPETRTLYPHIIFVAENKGTFLDAYQVDGFSSSGVNFPEWKQLFMSEIKSVSVSNETFKVVKSFNKKSPRYKNTIVKVGDK